MPDYPEIAYAEIQHTIPEDLEARVLAILQQHVGRDQRISRKALVEGACGMKLDDTNISNSRLDRQVRLVMDNLQEHHPILSTSGGGGYYYAGTADEIQRYAAELDSRAKKLLSKSKRLVKLAKNFQADLQLSFPV